MRKASDISKDMDQLNEEKEQYLKEWKIKFDALRNELIEIGSSK